MGQVSELGLLLNGQLLLLQAHHVALEDHKVGLAQLVAADVLSLGLDDVPIGLLLEATPRGLVQQAEVVEVVADEDCVEVGEYLEVDDGPVDGLGLNLEALPVPVDPEKGYRLLELPREVEGVLLLAVPEGPDDLVMAEFGYLLLGKGLAVEGQLVPGHHADDREGHYLQHPAHNHLVGVDRDPFFDFFGLAPYFFEVEEEDFLGLVGEGEPLVEHVEVVQLFHGLGEGELQLVESESFELFLGFAEEVGQVNRLNRAVGIDDPQPHGHLAVVEIDNLGYSSLVHLLAGSQAGEAAHVLVVNLYDIISMVETEDDFEVCGVVYLLDAVVMEQVVLLLLLQKLDVELCALRLLPHHYHLSDQVPEHLRVAYCLPALLHNLPEHIFKADHVEGPLLEGELHNTHDYQDEVLDPALPIGHPIHLLPNPLQLSLEYLPAYVGRRVLQQRLPQWLLQVVLAEVKSYAGRLLLVNQTVKGLLELHLPLFLFLPQSSHLLLPCLAHEQNYYFDSLSLHQSALVFPKLTRLSDPFPATEPGAEGSFRSRLPNSIIKQNSSSRMSLNDFVVQSKIGEGAYSSVHKVKRTSDGQLYALKKVKIVGLNEKEKQNALNQVRLLASFNSDFIIKYKEAFFDPKSSALCIIMEFADGGDLEKVIAKKKRNVSWVQQKQIWAMMRQTLAGISVLHERNIIHRDLKSANIFISGGVYKIADLNVSKLLKKELAYTQTGTPYYASPEVWQDKPYQLKSDIWSFGCILYELCALKPPFTATSMEGLYRKVLRGIYPKIPSLYSQKLSKVIDMCLKIDPAKRPSAKQLLKIIQTPQEEPPKTRTSSVNLLSTIRVPKNVESWKNDLPKADYETLSEKPADEIHPKFGNVSQHRLREIVRAKNEELNILKKEASKKVNPEHPPTIRHIEMAKPHAEKMSALDRSGLRKNQGEALPRIKIYSEPNEKPNDRIVDLLAKMREEERRRYEHNRPSWWG